MSPKVRFYGEDELHEYHQKNKKKRYKDKEDWEKFLEKERVKEKRRNKKVSEHEVSYDFIDSINGQRKV